MLVVLYVMACAPGYGKCNFDEFPMPSIEACYESIEKMKIDSPPAYNSDSSRPIAFFCAYEK